VSRTRALLLAGAGGLASLAVGALVFHLSRPDPATGQRAHLSSVAPNADPWIGRAAPNFALESLDGHLIRLADFRGKVVLVNFWATWCAPCRVEMPWLVDFSARYRSQGLEVIGISVDDTSTDTARIRRFVQEMKVTYPIVRQDDSVSAAYGGVRFLPQSFFVGRNGKVTAHNFGIRSKTDFEADIERSLSDTSG
jgi:peroxiredoxin